MAAGIPGARFVTLQGQKHLFFETEPAFGQFLRTQPGVPGNLNGSAKETRC